jgi:hypothetical protein
MQVNFDYFNQPELPIMILCNPDKTELYSLAAYYDATFTPRFNALSELKFTFPQSIDGGKTILDAYSYIKNKRLIKLDNLGYFQIIDAEEDMDGTVPIKIVSCQSLEAELINKRVVAFTGTYKMWDDINPEGTLLQQMINLAPSWSVASVDAELQVMFRTFSISDSNIYNFLMNDVETAFQCIFFFDTINKTITAKTLANATTNTDIFLSFDNVIDKATLTEKSDEMCTCLAVSGGGGLSINLVNPLGTNKIYNFSYYANTDWMKQDLVDAINAWVALVNLKQSDYSSNLLLLETYQSDLLALQSDMAQYQSDLLTIQDLIKVRIQQNLSYSDLNTKLANKKAQIASQQTLIDNKNLQITTIKDNLTAINTTVSFENNFTPSQLLELNEFIYENTYQNTNIIQTDTMTLVEIQQQSQSLYNQAVDVLSRVSQTRYEIVMDSVNYTALKEFQVFTQQTEVGCLVTAELSNGSFISTVLLEMQINLNDPSKFTMTFSNRLRMDGANFIYSDLMGSVQKTGSTVSFNSSQWSNWEQQYKNDVTTFISSALNTANNNLISNSNQEITINQNGLIGRSFDPSTGAFKDNQVWLTNNMLAFSDDKFQTSKLALGQITSPTGSQVYGVVGNYIVGHILAGNQLTISNDKNNFILDSTGAYLNNAKLTLQTLNTKIIIDPTSTNSFSIQKNEGGTFKNKFWVDNTGNVNFSGVLTGNSGSIGGWNITSTGISNGANYINSDGTMKIGVLTITPTGGIFNGSVSASSITGLIQANQIVGLPGSQITSGVITVPSELSTTGTIKWPGVTMGTTSTGCPYIVADHNLTITIGNNDGFSVFDDQVVLRNRSGAALEAYGNSLIMFGSLVVNGHTGVSVGYAVTTPYGTKYLYFANGILYNFT